MPEDSKAIQAGNAPNVEWVDAQYSFDGQWMPDLDPALIGPRNFATIENLRYNDRSVEGVNGYTTVNATALGYTLFRDGHQFRTNKTTNSFILASLTDDVNKGRVYINTGTIGAVSDFIDNDTPQTFDTTGHNFDTTGKPSAKVPYITDNSVSLIPAFSNAPQNSVMYCNGEDTKIFSGFEHRIATAFMCTDREGSNIIDVTDDLNNKLSSRYVTLTANKAVDGDMESGDPTANWGAAETPTVSAETGAANLHSGSKSIKIVTHAATGDQDGIISNAAIAVTNVEHTLTFWVKSSVATIYYWILDGDDGLIHADGAQTATVVTDTWTKIAYAVTPTAGSQAKIVIVGSANSQTFYVDDVSFTIADQYPELHIMTTRPIQGFKFYISTANGTAATLDVEYWNGTTFVDVVDDHDDTIGVATKTLSQSGFYRFAHTGGNAAGTATGGTYSTLNTWAEFRHFQELYLYAYRIRMSAGSAEIYHMTCDPGFQPVQNVWDGVYRQPIQFQIWDDSKAAFKDFTLHVNQSSDVQSPVGGQLDAMTSSDTITIMFEEQVAGIRLTMLGSLINTLASVLSLYYWNGFEWVNLATAHDFVDGTLNDAKTKSFTKTGLLKWSPPDDEQKQTLFNSLGYAYKIVISGTIFGTEDGTAEVLVDLVVGIPALRNTAGRHEISAFKFSCIFQNRLMLGAYEAGGEGNRMDYSVSNAPDVYNGQESSMDGTQSLYYGGVESITCATQLYNRFGATVYSMLLTMKDTEVYLVVGTNPGNFIIYPVSTTVGCPAPHTLATAEVGLDIGQGMTRNVAIWLSHYGPMMFDGAVLSPLTGINNYFDPNETEYVEWDAMKRARGWVDQTYKEYNLLIPSTSGQTTNNLWLVYDLLRKKWFKKSTGTAEFPQCAWNVMDPDTGEQSVYGGIDTGTMVHLEKGTSWGATYADPTAGSAITQKLRVGDFFPSNNIWDETLIRKFKIICKKIASTVSVSSHNLNISYFGDAAEDAANVIFQDADASSGIYVTFEDMDKDGDGTNETEWTSAVGAVLDLSMNVGLDRIVRLIQDLNEKGWAHSFEFVVATTDVSKGWQPIVWGIQYRVERKDNTAT